MDFVFEVVLPKLHQSFCRVNIVHTVLGGFFQLVLGQCSVNVEGDSGLLNGQPQVSFDSFKGQANLHIVFDVHIVEAEEEIPQRRVFPPLTTADKVIVDLFHLLRGKSTADRLDDELVVVLRVETYINVLLCNALFQFLIIVVDNGVFARIHVL